MQPFERDIAFLLKSSYHIQLEVGCLGCLGKISWKYESLSLYIYSMYREKSIYAALHSLVYSQVGSHTTFKK